MRHGQRWVSRQGEQALRFKNAAADNAQSVDLLVTVAEESDYHVNKVEQLDVLLGSDPWYISPTYTWGMNWGDITHWCYQPI